MNRHYSIAIDGPSGAGKSSIAKAVANRLGFIYVDTGAIYRTVGYAAKCAGADRRNEEEVKSVLEGVKIRIEYAEDGTQHMILNGEDVSAQIRYPEISIWASDVAALPAVRNFLLEMQRRFAEDYDVIMDGRDIGTVVLPQADLKIFLSASAEARAQRRLEEQKSKGISEDFDTVLHDIQYRDRQDTERASAPLKAAEDAVLLDNSNMPFDEELEWIVDLVKIRRKTAT